MNIKPVWDRLIVRKTGNETKTQAGLLIPGAANQGHAIGEVVACGDGKEDKPMSVKEGDTIMFFDDTVRRVTYNGEELYIMSENSVVGVVQ